MEHLLTGNRTKKEIPWYFIVPFKVDLVWSKELPDYNPAGFLPQIWGDLIIILIILHICKNKNPALTCNKMTLVGLGR